MTQSTAFGEAELTTYMKVEKTDGRVLYYRVRDGETVEIDAAAYILGGGA